MSTVCDVLIRLAGMVHNLAFVEPIGHYLFHATLGEERSFSVAEAAGIEQIGQGLVRVLATRIALEQFEEWLHGLGVRHLTLPLTVF